ncbi:MAG: HNH endonuclease [Acidimicrobiia bacterium]
MLWRDGGCRAPGCNSRYRLQPHHIHPRSHSGGHHPDNLVSLCWYHHHVVVHRRGMSIQSQPDGSIRFRVPQDSRDPP